MGEMSKGIRLVPGAEKGEGGERNGRHDGDCETAGIF
jgi:hypothetical protein